MTAYGKTITKSKTIHFIGIGGAGMCPIAKLLIQMGYKVAGSDLKESVNTLRLKDMGAKIYLKHAESHIREADIMVKSTAIPKDNPELMKAREENIPVLARAEMLHFLMQKFVKPIAVTGTHGKTTTSSMITRMLDLSNKHPSFVIGSDILDYGTNANLNGDEYIVVESDESDGSFLFIEPTIGVVTNMEEEHMNYYKTWDNLQKHFKQFMDGVIERKGSLVINADDEALCTLTKDYDNVIYFGTQGDAQVKASNIQHHKTGMTYKLHINGQDEGQVKLGVTGLHNVYNSLAAISVGVVENAVIDLCKKGLSKFSGTKRRLQLIGEQEGVTIFDDYAHHPTEIEVTLDGLKKAYKCRVTCIFQPHRYTRTQELMSQFAKALTLADEVIVTEVFASSEKPIPGVSGKGIIDEMKNSGFENAKFITKKSDIPPHLINTLPDHDIVVTMGAGDIYTVGKEMLKRLNILHEELRKKQT